MAARIAQPPFEERLGPGAHAERRQRGQRLRWRHGAKQGALGERAHQDHAEAEVNKYLSKRYDLSSATFKTSGAIPPIVTMLTERMAEGYLWRWVSRGGKESIAGLRREMMNTMEEHAGIYREAAGLQAACEKFGELRRRYANVELTDKTNVYNTDLLQALELGSMLDCAEAVTACALARTESRGAHQRLDFTARDDTKFLRHSLAHFQAGAAPRIDYLDVVITKSQPGVRDYSGGHE